MKTEVIKPKKQNTEKKNVITPILYLILGIVLAFKSNEAVTVIFYLLGILVIVYGIKSFVEYYRNREVVIEKFRKVNLGVGIVSVVVGILLIVLAKVIEHSIRYVLGFFLIFLGVTRLLTQISYGDYINLSTVSSIVLIILGIFSIFVSNIIIVIAGWLLIANAVLLFIDYFKN